MFCTCFSSLFCHFVSFLHRPLVHIWKIWKFSKFYEIYPFFILDNSIFTIHVRFLCIVVTICYKTSYMAPSVADIYFSASSINLSYLLLTPIVWPTRSFTAWLWLHLLNQQSNWAWRIFNGYSVLLIAREKFIPPSKERLLRQCNL